MNSKQTIEARFRLQFASNKAASFALDVDLHLPGQGIIALFGHSGSGKTTLLRCMAGLQACENASMLVNGRVWQNHNSNLPVHKRGLGYVFQEASLLPHLDVKANLLYALKRTAKQAASHFKQIVTMLDLEPLLRHQPQQLSGGERQRVAIARALLTQPSLLLMDEPLASLDISRKQEIMPYLEKLKATANIPIIYVSHDINEVVRLADHMVVLEQGKVAANGPINQVLPQIAGLAGLSEDASVILPAIVINKDPKWHLIQVAIANTQATLWLRDNKQAMGQPMRIRVLAKDVSVSLSEQQDSSILNRLPATVAGFHQDYDSAMILLELQLDGCSLMARITHRSREHLQLQVGTRVWAQIKSVALID